LVTINYFYHYFLQLIQNISILDYILLPVVIGLVYLFAYRYRNNHYGTKHAYRKYFIPGLTVKIIGAIFIGLIYQYYYKGGDTFNFFLHAKIINSSFADSPVKWFNLVFHIPKSTTVGYYQYISQLEWYDDTSSYMVASFTAVISFILGGTYLPTAVLFAVLSFSGGWALFRAFANIYPEYVKQIAIAVLFIPSVVIWGSGVFKDTLCLAALGWLVYSAFQILVNRNLRLGNIFIAVISIYIAYLVKLYILMAFLPALLIWVLFLYTRKIRSVAVKVLINLSVLAITFFTSYYAISNLGEEYLGKYSIENISQTSEITRAWINYASGDEGSAYDLGEVSSPAQMITKFPLAVNVTLFRPYLWEARKVIVFLSALEALLLLFLTLKIIFVIGFKKIWGTITSDPNIQFCLIFTLIFAFSVGISSYNFGALSRYKIPCLPFYGIALLLIYYKNAPSGKPLFKKLNI
jgi:hypothetical protein